VEHLTAPQRIHFFNELYRVMKLGGKATIITPNWASGRAYGDLTHQWPPVSEMFFQYLSRDWRKDQAPHLDVEFNPDGFDCNFIGAAGYSMNPAFAGRTQEFQMFAVTHYKEAAMDIICTLTRM
jgi:hypothetical protein